MHSQHNRPLIIGHRGAVGVMPENTQAAYNFALEHGVDGIEFDVHLSQDGFPIVLHDSNLRRTVGLDQFVDEMTLAQLRQLDAAAIHRSHSSTTNIHSQLIPTLQEVISWIPAPRLLCVELKTRHDGVPYPGLEEITVQAIRNASAENRTILSSFNFAILEKLRAIAPDIRRHAIIATEYFSRFPTSDYGQITDDLVSRHVDWVAVHKTFLTPSFVDALHNRGLLSHAWVVNTVEEFTHFAALGVSAVTTDRPDILCAAPLA